MAKKMSIKEYYERIQKSFPNWDFEIIEFSAMKAKAIIKCKVCNKIYNLKKAEDIFRKINACSCNKYFKDYHEKLQYFSKIYNFTILEDEPNNSNKKIQCNNCGTIMNRKLMSLLKTPDHCDNCHKYRKGITEYSKEEVQDKLNNQFYNEYELLEFNGMNKNALLKHKNCGFIFQIKYLCDIFNGRNRGCPKCYQFKSKGEQAIMRFLEQYKIKYIPQKTFSPLNKSKYRFDFFLPDFNLAIEYQGEQHYYENPLFNDDLNSTQKRDEIKRNYCKENNIELIEIPYWKYKSISQILTSRFNDYLNNESREKSLEADVAII